MKFNEIEQSVQDEIVDLLNKHLVASYNILKKDKVLEPLLVINENDNSKKIVGLQAVDGKTDVDKAYDKAISLIKDKEFKYAIFSYSTQMGTSTGQVTNAIKTTIIANNGLTVTFFSPYLIKGLFKKEVHIGETILYEIIENVFE